ncbi:hypothetical protein ACJZ2D_016254 [Fusarium nematophilum]
MDPISSSTDFAQSHASLREEAADAYDLRINPALATGALSSLPAAYFSMADMAYGFDEFASLEPSLEWFLTYSEGIQDVQSYENGDFPAADCQALHGIQPVWHSLYFEDHTAGCLFSRGVASAISPQSSAGRFRDGSNGPDGPDGGSPAGPTFNGGPPGSACPASPAPDNSGSHGPDRGSAAGPTFDGGPPDILSRAPRDSGFSTVLPMWSSHNLPSIGRVCSVVDQTEQVTFSSSIFPLQDFQPDENGNPLYVPKHSTSLSVTALHQAAYCGMEDVVRGLLVFSDVDKQPESYLASALSPSLFNSQRSTARLLLDQGANPNSPCYMSCLHAASKIGCLQDIEYFLRERKVNPDVQDMDGATAVVYALALPEERAIGAISLLFRYGAKTNAMIGENRWSYAALARSMGNEGLASWLGIHADTDRWNRMVSFIAGP